MVIILKSLSEVSAREAPQHWQPSCYTERGSWAAVRYIALPTWPKSITNQRLTWSLNAGPNSCFIRERPIPL